MTAKKVVKKEKTIEDEAQELLDKELHDIKVKEAARILTELSNLEVEYLKRKKKLEENLACVDSIRINSFGKNIDEMSSLQYYSSVH